MCIHIVRDDFRIMLCLVSDVKMFSGIINGQRLGTSKAAPWSQKKREGVALYFALDPGQLDL